jgi:nicotinate-nucleotide adenylyltransferase
MKIGILGGTFDPIHHGHLVAAGCCMEEYGLDKVVFVPAARPPHKPSFHVTAGEHRYNMAILAVQGLPGFEVSDIELNRPGRSYTADTLAQLKASNPNDELFFIMGQDTYVHFAEWKTPERILQDAILLVVSRPGEKAALTAVLPADEHHRVCFLYIPALDISSSYLRKRIRAGRTVRFLLPDAVMSYIRAQNLYQEHKL